MRRERIQWFCVYFLICLIPLLAASTSITPEYRNIFLFVIWIAMIIFGVVILYLEHQKRKG
jgi:uncharacterized membrane protein